MEVKVEYRLSTTTEQQYYHCANTACHLPLGVVLHDERGAPYLHVTANHGGNVLAVDVRYGGVWCECGQYTEWEPGRAWLDRIEARRRRAR